MQRLKCSNRFLKSITYDDEIMSLIKERYGIDEHDDIIYLIDNSEKINNTYDNDIDRLEDEVSDLEDIVYDLEKELKNIKDNINNNIDINELKKYINK